MIAKTFLPPNFACRVRPKDTTDQTQTRLERADSVAELTASLEDAGFEVLDIAPYDFKTWEDAAKLATKEACEAIEEGREYKFKESVWGGLRR